MELLTNFKGGEVRRDGETTRKERKKTSNPKRDSITAERGSLLTGGKNKGAVVGIRYNDRIRNQKTPAGSGNHPNRPRATEQREQSNPTHSQIITLPTTKN